jgi:hypothetical protein
MQHKQTEGTCEQTKAEMRKPKKQNEAYRLVPKKKKKDEVKHGKR